MTTPSPTDGPFRQVKEEELDWSRLRPCGDCPFLRTSPYHEGVAANLLTYCDTIDRGKFLHSCHKTDPRSDCEQAWTYKGPLQVCAGSVLMLLKTGDGKDLQLPLLKAAEAGRLDLEKAVELAKRSPKVFTLKELILYYGRKVGQMLGEKLKRRR